MLLHKYRPGLENFKQADVVEHLLKNPPVRVLITGNGGVGKTSLANLIATKSGAEVFRVSNLDQSMAFIRSDVKTFCTTVKDRRKMLLVDNLDMIAENAQHIMLKILPPDVHFVATATHRHGVCESVHSTIIPFNIDPFTKEDLLCVMARILEGEGCHLSMDLQTRLVDYSNLSCRRMINLLQKVMLLPEVTMEAVDEACVHIACIPALLQCLVARDVQASIDKLVSIHQDGYTVLDILYSITNYIPLVDIPETLKYEWVKVCCKYIAIYYERHEHPIELVFLAHDLNSALTGL